MQELTDEQIDELLGLSSAPRSVGRLGGGSGGSKKRPRAPVAAARPVAAAGGWRRSCRAVSALSSAAVERRRGEADRQVEGTRHAAAPMGPPRPRPKPKTPLCWACGKERGRGEALADRVGGEGGEGGERGEGGEGGEGVAAAAASEEVAREVAEEVAEEVEGLCGACAVRWKEGAYCPVCMALWEEDDGDMLG